MNMEGTSLKREARKGKKPDCTWEVRANDRSYHNSIKKKAFLCLRQQKYAGNSITTSKYNVLTFIPLNLFHQLQQGYLIYLVVMVVLQCIPLISPSPWFVSTIPLSALVSLRAVKDLIEDLARRKSDRMINNRPSEILHRGSFCSRKWRDIQVGDIVRLKKDDLVPADMLLLQSSEPNSLCYVETSSIDGETNLKFRQSPLITHIALNSVEALAAFDGKVICEAPNSKMHTFVGTLEWNGEKCPLDNDKMLLRGCSIRNTQTCYGLVIYTGTRLMSSPTDSCSCIGKLYKYLVT